MSLAKGKSDNDGGKNGRWRVPENIQPQKTKPTPCTKQHNTGKMPAGRRKIDDRDIPTK